MPIKCILACSEELLLGSIVEDLLTQNEGLELIEVIGKSQMELIEAIEAHKPHVLVLCHKSHDTIPTDYLDILQKLPELLIITVSTDDNYMHIYGRQKVLIRRSTDLLSVIQSQ
jgi:hypothetical protein